MKIKTIARSEEDFCRKTKHDITKVHRNRDPALHPFERAREYSRALVATKLDKIFAKPFIGALDGHKDSIHCISTIRNKVVPFISGSCDGEIKVWDLSRKACFWSAVAHSGFVRGIAPDEGGNSFYTCGDDKMIKRWALLNPANNSSSSSSPYLDSSTDVVMPINTIIAPHSLTGIDHHWVDQQFATCGETVCVWDSSRASSIPVHSYTWGADSVTSLRFNPAEACLLASTAADRSVCLYDLRAALPMRKFVLPMKSNNLAWNPLEPFNFVLACEDHNLYTFDMRKLSEALMIHKDHVGAVMDVSFSPTGREFVSGSYDNTIRIFKYDQGRSREVYHTKRMQHVFAVAYSSDSRYILSGSDDTNVRIWKNEAAAQLGITAGREDRKLKYLGKLKKRFAHLPEIKRITADKNVPKYIKKARAIEQVQLESRHCKDENRRRHSKPTEVESKISQRSTVVLKEFS